MSVLHHVWTNLVNSRSHGSLLAHVTLCEIMNVNVREFGIPAVIRIVAVGSGHEDTVEFSEEKLREIIRTFVAYLEHGTCS